MEGDTWPTHTRSPGEQARPHASPRADCQGPRLSQEFRRAHLPFPVFRGMRKVEK